MYTFKHSLDHNAKLLKSTVSKHALYGLATAFVSIVIASCLAAFQQTGEVSLAGIIDVQKHNNGKRLCGLYIESR